MPRFPLVASVACALLLIAGCADTVRIYDGPERPPAELALLHPSSEYERGVLSSSYAEGGGVGLSTIVLSTWPRIYLIAVDGRAVPGAGNKALEIEAGKHVLKVRAIAAGGTNQVYEFEVEVQGGIAYNVAVFDKDGQWVTRVVPRARWRRE